MHDPMTVAWEVPNPFAKRWDWEGARWRDRDKLVVIWHVDPERDGSDDSCDWAGYKAKRAGRRRLRPQWHPSPRAACIIFRVPSKLV